MMNRYKAFIIGLVIFNVMLCSGCQYTWYFDIVDTEDPGHPYLCFSEYPKCIGSGIHESMINIYEVNEKGEKIRQMWGLILGNSEIKKIKYGSICEGAEEVVTAIPLEIGKFYKIASGANIFFFRLYQRDEKIRKEIYSLKEFVKDLGRHLER